LHYFCTFALLKSAIVQSHFLVDLLKTGIVQLHFFALFKSAIAQSLFKISKCAKLCENSANYDIELFLHFKKSDRTFSKCAIAQPCLLIPAI